VSSAFLSLRKHIPYENRHKRLSKVKTLRIAIDYIRELEHMLGEHNSVLDGLLGNTHVISDLQQNAHDHAHGQSILSGQMQQFPVSFEHFAL
jgi:achaete-scute complex protein